MKWEIKSEILNVTTIDSQQLKRDVRINVTTIGIEKANSIIMRDHKPKKKKKKIRNTRKNNSRLY